MIPRFIASAEAGTLPTIALDGLSPAQQAAAGVAAWGVSGGRWAWIHVLANGFGFLVSSLVAMVILLRVRTSFGLLTAFILLGTGSAAMSTVIYSAGLPTMAQSIWNASGLIWIIFFPWLYLFPNGRAVPRRLLWLFIPLMAAFGLPYGVSTIRASLPNLTWLADPLNELMELVETLIIFLFFLVSAAQIYRYANISTGVERAQTRWFIFGLMLTYIPSVLFEDLLGWQAPAEVGNIVFSALPLGIGISILRYRLYDIDIIIRKTLIYALLTGTLALVFFLSVVLLQRILPPQSQLGTGLSTLGIAALFSPLRRRVQSSIDRIFYRRKYSAEKALAAFRDSVRDEVDLERLSETLLSTVEETMQPGSLVLWLKEVRR